MSDYAAPLEDMRFVLNHVVDLPALSNLPGLNLMGEQDLIDQILDEASKFAGNVLAPLNQKGDTEGARIENGVVRAAEGYGEAYRQWADAGWNSVPFGPDYGGQGLPWALNTALWEMWDASNLAFSLCPLLTQGAIDALERNATPALKSVYLDKLISGDWTGTMNLTEPQSGSDLGAIRARSEKKADHYLIRGQKIFITWGDHDMTDNIIHLVLARSPEGPPGTRGLSLFVVPKYLVNPDGSLGRRNDVRPVSLENKIGIHASPTCVMGFGETEGAVGFLVGEENHGIECMFVMMNNARLGVGLQGLAIAERAYQQAVAFSRERVQGRPIQDAKGVMPIIHHPDVRRMLLSMKARIEAMRGLCYWVAAELDRANRIEDQTDRAAAQAMVDLMIPVVKAWCTDTGLAITSTNVQVHGGMGFIEETGAGQHYRDARITTIYEGTNGIQAMDLLSRKIIRDGGETAKHFAAGVRGTIDGLNNRDLVQASLIRHLSNGIDAFENAVTWFTKCFGDNPGRAGAGAVPFLEMMGLVSGGWLLARGTVKAQGMLDAGIGDARFLKGKLSTAHYYAEAHLAQASTLLDPIIGGSDVVMSMDDAQF